MGVRIFGGKKKELKEQLDRCWAELQFAKVERDRQRQMMMWMKEMMKEHGRVGEHYVSSRGEFDMMSLDEVKESVRNLCLVLEVEIRCGEGRDVDGMLDRLMVLLMKWQVELKRREEELNNREKL